VERCKIIWKFAQQSDEVARYQRSTRTQGKAGTRHSECLACPLVVLGNQNSAGLLSKCDTIQSDHDGCVVVYGPVIGCSNSYPQRSWYLCLAGQGRKASVRRSGAKCILHRANVSLGGATEGTRSLLHGSFIFARAFRLPGSENRNAHEINATIDWPS
jgi:hypothetical protein